MSENFASLGNFLLVVANAILLPAFVEFLNSYVKNTNYRSLITLIVAVLCGILWAFILADGNWSAAIANSAVIWTVAQAVFYKVVVPARDCGVSKVNDDRI